MAKSTYKTNEFIKFPNQYHGDIIVFSHFISTTYSQISTSFTFEERWITLNRKKRSKKNEQKKLQKNVRLIIKPRSEYCDQWLPWFTYKNAIIETYWKRSFLEITL